MGIGAVDAVFCLTRRHAADAICLASASLAGARSSAIASTCMERCCNCHLMAWTTPTPKLDAGLGLVEALPFSELFGDDRIRKIGERPELIEGSALHTFDLAIQVW